MGQVQNNNGNYSWRLVPIHLLQPKPQLAWGYCYSGRLLLPRRSVIPATHGFQVLHFIALPSCCPFLYPQGATSRTKCLSGIHFSPPEGSHYRMMFSALRLTCIFSSIRDRSPSVSWSPVTQSLKERFRFHRSSEHPWTRSISFRLRLSWRADPEVWMNRRYFN